MIRTLQSGKDEGVWGLNIEEKYPYPPEPETTIIRSLKDSTLNPAPLTPTPLRSDHRSGM